MIPAGTSALSHLLDTVALAEHDAQHVRYAPSAVLWRAVKGAARTAGDSVDAVAERTYRLAFGDGAPLGSRTSAQAVDSLVARLIAQWAAGRADAHPVLADAFALRLALRRAIASRWPLTLHRPAAAEADRPVYGYRVVDGETVIRPRGAQQRRSPQLDAVALRREAARHDRVLGAAGLRDVLRTLCGMATAGSAQADRILVLRHSGTPLRVDRGLALGPALLDVIAQARASRLDLWTADQATPRSAIAAT
ncbi:hypothetical protein [Kitasatospora sp. NPDC088779]|uniref:hypothetical protein n=1 Tax=unclassified Kitasatospora TaxID=2633591 RepID=UPI00341226F9